MLVKCSDTIYVIKFLYSPCHSISPVNLLTPHICVMLVSVSYIIAKILIKSKDVYREIIFTVIDITPNNL
jgi:hypothetical protein